MYLDGLMDIKAKPSESGDLYDGIAKCGVARNI